QTLVVVGETGSGKSTQIPQYLYEAGFCGGSWMGGGGGAGAAAGAHRRLKDRRVIACTQPRRVAAITVAKRVAAEAGTEVGQVVGYSVRFDDCSSEMTSVKYMTDGVLLREAMSDPLLSLYSVVVLDEAHERSLQTDILFGLVRRVQSRRREDFRVVVMSATLDTKLFLDFFQARDSVGIHVPGRTHPVDIMYTIEPQASDDYVDAALVTCLQIHEFEPLGDVLVFLPGQEDIEGLEQLLREKLVALRAEASRLDKAEEEEPTNDRGGNKQQRHELGARPQGKGGEEEGGVGGVCSGEQEGLRREALVCPVFAALPQEQQLKAFSPAPRGARKFVLATNIAETSITINGIRYVVDTGKFKVRSFHPSTGMEYLKSRDVSKAQATQRTGRAGRERPGVCYRLYRQGLGLYREAFLKLEDTAEPEIQRVNLCQVVLQLKVMGIDRPQDFDYVTPPSSSSLLAALKSLVLLGALDKKGELTRDGGRMAMLPLDPTFAHLLVRSVSVFFL
ncbi:unnamed protein product, partial [Discosporangium mesarthrocarpum]